MAPGFFGNSDNVFPDPAGVIPPQFIVNTAKAHQLRMQRGRAPMQMMRQQGMTPAPPPPNGEEALTVLKDGEIGMECGYKNLYSGKEDKRGRFQWQDTPPDDLGTIVEDAASAKWALLVRNVKAYNDPRRVLRIHSIVVQSPLLKGLLRGVLSGYPGVTTELDRLEFSGRFEPIIHRWSEFKEKIEELQNPKDPEKQSEEDLKTREHAELLQGILVNEFQDVVEVSQDMKAKGVMTFELLWTLFQPGSLIYTRQESQDRVFKLQSSKYGEDRNANPVFWLTCKYVDFDGSKFGTIKLNLLIHVYNGTRSITSLAAFPFALHPSMDELSEKLVARGARFESLAGSHYKGYNGIGWKLNQLGEKDKYAVKGRIIIDLYGWNRFNPNNAVYVTPFAQKEQRVNNRNYDEIPPPSDDCEGGYDECDGGMPIDGIFADDDESTKYPPLSYEQKLIATHLIRGYSLKEKLWLNLFVNAVQEVIWSAGAFESLVLPAKQKELILGFTQTQSQYRQTFDDVIEGKGKGIILLLCGPPGVGKTLTAESVAEEMKVPLFMMSAGDLGLDPSRVEAKLQSILEMCTRWNAILLLDEADVFLEQRSLHELERNKLVSIFLRILEYYEGIMFLTTNRVGTFDPAFQSRIHISLDYPELSAESRKLVWKNFLGQSLQQNTITDKQLDQLATMTMNGRQIKNVLKTAQLLASRKDSPLKHEHVMTVLDVTQHLHNSTMETERARSAIFA
ncbi:MAG: hypothetical protein M1821_002069 [Bathelium mastoideum]|nr:MAG: hypothetical protein M1821_002069 [Bathelium mastoideum]